MNKNTNVRNRIAQINGLNEAWRPTTMLKMSDDIRMMRAQLSDQRRVVDGPAKDFLKDAIDGLTAATDSLERYITWKEQGDDE
jgi:hypothetical protein